MMTELKQVGLGSRCPSDSLSAKLRRKRGSKLNNPHIHHKQTETPSKFLHSTMRVQHIGFHDHTLVPSIIQIIIQLWIFLPNLIFYSFVAKNIIRFSNPTV